MKNVFFFLGYVNIVAGFIFIIEIGDRLCVVLALRVR